MTGPAPYGSNAVRSPRRPRRYGQRRPVRYYNLSQPTLRLMSRLLACLLLLLSTSACSTSEAPPSGKAPPTDYVLHNASIYTVDAAKPNAEALAVSNGAIVGVGAADSLLAVHPEWARLDAGETARFRHDVDFRDDGASGLERHMHVDGLEVSEPLLDRRKRHAVARHEQRKQPDASDERQGSASPTQGACET